MALCLVVGLFYANGDIRISESITKFRYPKFSENGYVEWVLEGNSGEYEEQTLK